VTDEDRTWSTWTLEGSDDTDKQDDTNKPDDDGDDPDAEHSPESREK
jgi:hypothetical protein